MAAERIVYPNFLTDRELHLLPSRKNSAGLKLYNLKNPSDSLLMIALDPDRVGKDRQVPLHRASAVAAVWYRDWNSGKLYRTEQTILPDGDRLVRTYADVSPEGSWEDGELRQEAVFTLGEESWWGRELGSDEPLFTYGSSVLLPFSHISGSKPLGEVLEELQEVV